MKNIMELTGARLKAAENWYKRQVKNGAQPHCVIDSTGCHYLFCKYSAIRWYGSMLPVEESISHTQMEKTFENIFFSDVEREEVNISIETLKSELDCAKEKAGLSTRARFDTEENYHERLIAWKNFKLRLRRKRCKATAFINGDTNSMDVILMPVMVNK